MDGYRRSHWMTERLSAALVQVLRERPTERFGQLLCNTLRVKDSDLFNTVDEVIDARLRRACENEPDAFGCDYSNVGHGGCALAATADSPPPSVIQLLDVTDELAHTTESLRSAVELLEAFDKFVRLDEDDTRQAFSGGYAGSPFQTQVQAFLAQNGVRSS